MRDGEAEKNEVIHARRFLLREAESTIRQYGLREHVAVPLCERVMDQSAGEMAMATSMIRAGFFSK